MCYFFAILLPSKNNRNKNAAEDAVRKGGNQMKYIVLVSHGAFADGMASALKMLDGGDRSDIISVGLKPEEGAEVFVKKFKDALKVVKAEDEILMFGDLASGSPLTMSANAVSEMGLLDRATIYGGANLPLILNASLMKDAMEMADLKEMLLNEAHDELKLMDFSGGDDDGEI